MINFIKTTRIQFIILKRTVEGQGGSAIVPVLLFSLCEGDNGAQS